MKLRGKPFKINWRVIATLYAVILLILNFIRIFDNNFWGDEAFTIELVPHALGEMIHLTAIDVHPPLYYLIVKLGYMICGDKGWMFHFISLIPCVIEIIFALTVLWKKFGKEVAFIFITFAAFSINAISFNMEVRMYSWGALFILLSFFMLYEILCSDEKKPYIWFVVFSLAAAYTHYYCLIAVAFMYVGLLLGVVLKKITLKKVLISYVATILLYLPWLFVFLRQAMTRSKDYWITDIPTKKMSFDYLFSGIFTGWKWVLLCVVFLVILAFECGMLRVEKIDQGNMHVIATIRNASITVDAIWMTIGVMSVIGTIATGILVSKLIRPFYELRYLYPATIVAWLLLALAVSKIKYREIVATLLLIYAMVNFIPSYQYVYEYDKDCNNRLQETLSKSLNVMDADDVIYTNDDHLAWTVLSYYYPEHTILAIDFLDVPKLEKGQTYWFIVSAVGMDMEEELLSQIEKQGVTATQVVEEGNIGTYDVDIFQVTK